MWWKLLITVACVLAVLHDAASSNVVNFNHLSNERSLDSQSETVNHARLKRSSETDSERNDNKCASQKEKFQKAIEGDRRLETTHVFGNESKFSLALAWAGSNDDGVLVVLTSEAVNYPVSTLWRSKDYGRTWNNISSAVDHKAFRKQDGLQRNPHNPKWLYLISYEHYLYKSEDGGQVWKKCDLVATVKSELIFHEDKKYPDYIMVVTTGNKLIMTKDNFDHVETVRDKGVHSAHWGAQGTFDPKPHMFVTIGDVAPSIFPFLLDNSVSSYDLVRRSADGGDWLRIRRFVVDFSIQADFLYASVYNSNPDANSERFLVVSNDGGNHWSEAQLPTITSDRFFSVLDMSESLIFMHVDNPGDTGHGTLYTSSSKGVFFSESLQRHLYPNYNSITDFYKISSMRGTYIASQLSSDNSIHSVITFDLGGEWQPLAKPDDVPCKEGETGCSLQIHNSYSIHRGVKAHPPLSTEDAVGLIIANAHVAKNLQTTDPDVFISSNGGYSWRKVLDGPHAYVIADSGGLIVAISMATPTPKEVKFSMDEGRCWHVYQYTTQEIHHTGLLTEPGGKSMTVALWGYSVGEKKWTINVIDFADVITDHCTDGDYEDWMPHETMKKEDPNRKGCLMGRRSLYKRLKPDSWCHNGYQYKAQVSHEKCQCTFEDYECDYGFYRPDGQERCVEQPNFNGPHIDVCYRGHEYEVISTGYRKLPGDICEGGFSPKTSLMNLTEICTGRITVKPEPKFELHDNDSSGSGSVWLIILIVIIVCVGTVGLSYFGYKMVLLRRHKVVYRYSMLNQNDDKDYDEEIERTLSGGTPHPMFGEISDEEELPAVPRQNGHVQKSRPHMTGYHDDSDDDMLN